MQNNKSYLPYIVVALIVAGLVAFGLYKKNGSCTSCVTEEVVAVSEASGELPGQEAPVEVAIVEETQQEAEKVA